MGIFNKLFGKKKDKSEITNKPSSANENIIPENNFAYIRTPEETESMIVRNPLAAQYRLKFQQLNADMTSLDYIPFYQKAKDGFVALDFETTGFSYIDDMIVEIGAVKVEHGQIVDTYHQYVNPEKPMSVNASKVNHITDDMLVTKPYIFEVLPDLLHFIDGKVIVAHNVAFDYKFLAQSCIRYRFRIPTEWFDSMDLAEIWPEATDRKLKTFLSVACIENTNEHSALGDSEALALLVIKSFDKKSKLKIPDGVEMNYSTEHFKGSVEQVDNKLSGMKFVVTGKINGYERYDFEKLIASHGGKATIKISNATDYLVVGDFDGMPPGYLSAKEDYARKLISEGGKIKIISPAEFFQMIK